MAYRPKYKSQNYEDSRGNMTVYLFDTTSMTLGKQKNFLNGIHTRVKKKKSELSILKLGKEQNKASPCAIN